MGLGIRLIVEDLAYGNEALGFRVQKLLGSRVLGLEIRFIVLDLAFRDEALRFRV